ncbi:hypothetical protein L1887_16521 [Cichorium endivia]|nr:hypothetical protein L1887_16521 [Cichorium endivia]
MGDSTSSYIHMIQHLIEKCLIFGMNKEECMEALCKHANIKPIITSTVWNELEKENKKFFESYWQSRSQYLRKPDQMSELVASEQIQKMVFDLPSKSSKTDDDQ